MIPLLVGIIGRSLQNVQGHRVIPDRVKDIEFRD